MNLVRILKDSAPNCFSFFFVLFIAFRKMKTHNEVILIELDFFKINIQEVLNENHEAAWNEV